MEGAAAPARTPDACMGLLRPSGICLVPLTAHVFVLAILQSWMQMNALSRMGT